MILNISYSVSGYYGRVASVVTRIIASESMAALVEEIRKTGRFAERTVQLAFAWEREGLRPLCPCFRAPGETHVCGGARCVPCLREPTVLYVIVPTSTRLGRGGTRRRSVFPLWSPLDVEPREARRSAVHAAVPTACPRGSGRFGSSHIAALCGLVRGVTPLLSWRPGFVNGIRSQD
jgi:hypothetical protein